MTRPRAFLIAAGLLAGCSPFPNLDDRVSPEALAAPSPVLVPNGPLLATAPGPADAAEAAAPVLARAAILQRRAAGLAGPVVDAETRARLAEARAVQAARDR